MLLEDDHLPGSHQQIWKCLACGREVRVDPREQAVDDRMLQKIRQDVAAALAARQLRQDEE
jgi:hypothetical protein